MKKEKLKTSVVVITTFTMLFAFLITASFAIQYMAYEKVIKKLSSVNPNSEIEVINGLGFGLTKWSKKYKITYPELGTIEVKAEVPYINLTNKVKGGISFTKVTNFEKPNNFLDSIKLGSFSSLPSLKIITPSPLYWSPLILKSKTEQPFISSFDKGLSKSALKNMFVSIGYNIANGKVEKFLVSSPEKGGISLSNLSFSYLFGKSFKAQVGHLLYAYRNSDKSTPLVVSSNDVNLKMNAGQELLVINLDTKKLTAKTKLFGETVFQNFKFNIKTADQEHVTLNLTTTLKSKAYGDLKFALKGQADLKNLTFKGVIDINENIVPWVNKESSIHKNSRYPESNVVVDIEFKKGHLYLDHKKIN